MRYEGNVCVCVLCLESVCSDGKVCVLIGKVCVLRGKCVCSEGNVCVLRGKSSA